MADAAGTTVWRWDNHEPFGLTGPHPDPDGNGQAFVFNLRFAGQYFDAESGLFHNRHRDYDSASGRYVQADPIGLAGGISLYSYVGANPLGFVDPLGLACERPGAQAAKGLPDGARWAQKTFGPNFDPRGTLAGKSFDDVAGGLRSGAIKPSSMQVDYVVRDGQVIIHNTRSASALDAAGIPRSQWNAVNQTGNAAVEARVNGQLARNPGGPFDTVKPSW